MTKAVKFTVVDAFVIDNEQFTGNSAAVIVLDSDCEIPDDKKQKIAAEFNLSETVFVSQIKDSDRRLIRWFTPTTEVELCGHATIAASYVLFQADPRLKSIKYKSHFGLELGCSLEEDGQLTLDFPVQLAIKLFPEMNAHWLPQLTRAVFGEELATKVVDYQLSPASKNLLLRLDDNVPAETFSEFTPNFNDMLTNDNGNQVFGVIATQKSNYAETNLHFRSRYFAPGAGVNEDPVTGSSFTVLTPYWAQAYLTEAKGEPYCSGLPDGFRSLQASRRGGIVHSRIAGDRVFISGSAVKFSSGTLEY